MKWKFSGLLVLFCCVSALAQEATTYIKAAEEKAYNPRSKGLTDLVVDLVNPQLTKQLNDQMIFGRLNQVSFRFYWTAQPERIAIEVLGLPQGFREIKEELKAAMIGRLESVIPIPLEKKLESYQFRVHPSKPRTVEATAQNGLLPIPEFELSFDNEGRLATLVGKKPIGLMTSVFSWQKAPWSEPRSYVTKVISRSEDGPQTTESETDTSWIIVSGMGLPSVVKSRTKQTLKPLRAGDKPIERIVEETLQFQHYKVNVGEAMKWFLGNNAPVQ